MLAPIYPSRVWLEADEKMGNAEAEDSVEFGQVILLRCWFCERRARSHRAHCVHRRLLHWLMVKQWQCCGR